MGDLSCTPWRRYGHDRVYVSDGATRLGYLDRTNGHVAVDDSTRLADVRAALARAGHLPDAEPPRADPEPWALTLPGDTATYRAGAGARAKAAEERAVAPVRTMLDRVRAVHTPERAWRVGAVGEETVARRLRRLGDEWVVLHDLPLGDKGNVDHVAIGPGGVFTMNTKNLGSKVRVDGDSFDCNGYLQRYVPAARREASRAARLLGTPVHGVIVVLADDVRVKAQPDGVTVVEGIRIRRWLAARPAVLTPGDVKRLERVARDPRPWRTG